MVQAAQPSPFYFFDEIDCALDTVRLTQVLSPKSNASDRNVQGQPYSLEKQLAWAGPRSCTACLLSQAEDTKGSWVVHHLDVVAQIMG
jgi:hypothetical protein